MKIGILSRNQTLYSTRRLVQAGRLRGHQVRVIDTLSIPARAEDGSLLAAGEATLPGVDAIIPRIGSSITPYGLAVVRQFEAHGILTTATAIAIARSRNKLSSYEVMQAAGLPMPKTEVVNTAEDIEPAVQAVGGFPVIVKLVRGTQGRGVFLISEIPILQAIFDLLQRVRQDMLIQEYIHEAGGSDVRIIVVDGRCIAAMQRTAAEGEFRSNLHRGGSAEPMLLNQEMQTFAVQAAEAHGLSVAGIDILLSKRGPLFIEANSSPGLEGIERTTRADVAGEIIHFLEREARKQKKRPQYSRRRGTFSKNRGA
ncbi:MAG: RimK family alpha-L-glutamate ligase [Candidatus Promineifilaceae bacterium]